MTEQHTTQLRRLLARLDASEPAETQKAALEELIRHSSQRLEAITRRMLHNSPRVHRWEQTDDVFQNSLIRLHRALLSIRPQSPQEYYGLAAAQVRRELVDLARHYHGPQGIGSKHQTGYNELERGGFTPNAGEPNDLEQWAEFHEAVGRLPDAEREVFQLLWYEGLEQKEAAELLGVTDRTVKSRWRNAKLKLSEVLAQDAAAVRGGTSKGNGDKRAQP